MNISVSSSNDVGSLALEKKKACISYSKDREDASGLYFKDMFLSFQTSSLPEVENGCRVVHYKVSTMNRNLL